MSALSDRYGYVYVLIDPRTNRTRYIGVTHTTLERRLYQHMAAGRSFNRGKGKKLPIVMWTAKLLDLGLQPIIVPVSYNAAICTAYEWEAHLIQLCRQNVGSGLLNVANGGVGGGIGPKSATHRANMSKAVKGRKNPPRTDEWRSAHSAKMTGRVKSVEVRRAISEGHKRRAAQLAITKICKCGSEFQVLPSRVTRIHWCSIECPAKIPPPLDIRPRNAKRKDGECLYGHKMTPDNSYIKPNSPRSAECRMCIRIRTARKSPNWVEPEKVKVL